MSADRIGFRMAPLAVILLGGAIITYYLLPREAQSAIPGGVVGLYIVYLVVLSAPILWLLARLEDLVDHRRRAGADESQSHDTPVAS